MDNGKSTQMAARARQEDLVVQEMPDEVLVYDLKQHKAHCLNRTAAFVWNHCDGYTTVTEMAALMEKEWGEPVGEDAVWLALKQLSRADLLQERVMRTGDGMHISRRSVMRKLGIAAMVPAVVSIVAPTALAGPSIPPACVTCSIFGSGMGRSNTCPAECTTAFSGCCFNNASCMGVGGAFLNTDCNDCFNAHSTPGSTSSSWRASGAGQPSCP